MSTARLLVCDHAEPSQPLAPHWSADAKERTDCPARSRWAATEPVLRVLAERDGWVLLPNGRHFCPDHREETT